MYRRIFGILFSVLLALFGVFLLLSGPVAGAQIEPDATDTQFVTHNMSFAVRRIASISSTASSIPILTAPTLILTDLQKVSGGVSSRYVITNTTIFTANTAHGFYQNDGVYVASEYSSLSSGEVRVYDLATIATLPDGYAGYVIVSADQPLTGTVLVAQARTFTVSKTADTNDGVCDADCSLREAIRAANANFGDDTIILPSGNYTLTIAGAGEDAAATGDLDITDNLVIIGGGANTTINGGGVDRVFHITGAFPATISNVTIRGGNAGTDLGGGISNPGGTLTLVNSAVISNTAGNGGGIYNGGGFGSGGTLSITNSSVNNNTVTNGGGAVYNNGVLTITASVLSGNSATAYGGGIANVSGYVAINTSAISGNSAGTAGGGIYNFYFMSGADVSVNTSTISGNSADTGGGVYNDAINGTLTFTTSTLSGNSAKANGGGIANVSGTGNLNNVTITNNTADIDISGTGDGGGLSISSGTITLRNTIVAGNVDNSSSGNIHPDCSGTINSQGYNHIQSITGCTISGDTTGNVTGQSANLGPLRDNGGPIFTHALLPGSPAIDAGNPATPGSGGNACEATDQRGVARPQGSHCDIGAYEYPGAQTSVTPSTSSTLVYTDTTGNNSSVAVPTGAVTQTTTLLYTAGTTTTTAPSGFTFAGVLFTLNAYQGTTLLPGFTFQQPVTVTLTYTDTTLGGLSENTLTLDYWNGSAWVDAATSCNPTSMYVRDPAQNRLSVAICHLSEFALFGQRQIYLPLILKQ